MSQSDFAYPNSDTKPQESPVSGSVVKVFPIWQPVVFDDPHVTEQAVAKALAGTGGDLLVNGDYEMQSQNYFLFTVVTVKVTGMPVKMPLITRYTQQVK